MNRTRPRVRVWATVWLVCQLAAVSAFIPRDCCAFHRPVAASTESHGHHGAAPGHHGSSHHGRSAPDHDRACVMRGTCNGPLDAIATLFLAPGLAQQSYSLLDSSAPRRVLPQADASEHDGLHPPTTPPPRA